MQSALLPQEREEREGRKERERRERGERQRRGEERREGGEREETWKLLFSDTCDLTSVTNVPALLGQTSVGNGSCIEAA